MEDGNMSGILMGQKFIEKFYCHCGKECKTVKIVKSQGSKGPAGMMWHCEDGHTERQWHHKEQKAKG
jgi:hypothetical protein